MDLHRLAEERSLAYHLRVAQLLGEQPEILSVARQRATAWAESGEHHAPYARAWLAILDGGIERIRAALTDDSEHGRALRQATPFAGAVDPRERWKIWREVRERMEQEDQTRKC
ncbi:MAG TPA: hypothetical protein VGH20_18345 [Myxococcales bacterium]|jgi:hypothetical protein